MNKLLVTIIALYCAVCINHAYGQAKTADTVLVANMGNAYNNAIGRQSGLYRGSSYSIYNVHSKGNAYFNDSTALVTGAVNYDGIQYHDVPLLYDLYQDILVSRLQNSVFLYHFLDDKVANFDMPGHHFVRIQPANATKMVPVGYYEEVYKISFKF